MSTLPRRLLASLLLSSACVLGAVATGVGQSTHFRPVIIEGETIDGLAVRDFVGGFPANVLPGFDLNNRGEVVLYSRAGDGFGIFRAGLGGKDLVVQTGMPAPGLGPDVFFNRPRDPVRIDDQGTVLFDCDVGSLTPSIRNSNSIWLSPEPGNLAAVVYPGLPVPDRATQFEELSTFYKHRLNRYGEVAFAAREEGTGVHSDDDESLWTYDTTSGLTRVAREGDLAPGTSVRYEEGSSSPAFSDFFLADSGVVTFECDLTDSPHQGLFAGSSAADVAPVVLRGAATPGGPAGSLIGIALVTGNSAGDVAFRANVLLGDSSRKSAIWTVRGDSLDALAYTGEGHPDMEPGESFSIFNRTAIGDAGDVFWQAILAGPAVTADNDDSRWFSGSGGVRMIAREGLPVEGHPHLVFSEMDDSGVVGPHGRVLLVGEVEDTTAGGALSRAMFLFDEDLGMFEVVREGDLIELAPGDVREVSDVSTGLLNDAGELAVKLEFDGDTDAILLTGITHVVPEPSAALSAGVGLVLVCLFRLLRRRGCQS